jgi:metallophosphoesterase (TIGR00282 family)
MGVITVSKSGIELAIINICGRVFIDGYDDPFRVIENTLDKVKTKHIFVDFHAEITSEKVAFGFHLDGRVSAVVGTHTHVTTADEKVLPEGTAYISDVGMCGPWPSVLGVDKDIILKKFRTSMPARFEVAKHPGVISGVLIDVKGSTGRANSIVRIASANKS